jgi:hypothetical protein
LGAAADIEEVGRIAAVVFDDVHGGHGEAGAVDEAGDVAVEADVVEFVLGGGHFARVLLVLVAHRPDLGVAVERVVVEVELRVEGVHVAVGGDDHRVDLDHRAIALDEELVERVEQAAELAGGGGEAEVVAELAHLIGLQAGERMTNSRRIFSGVFSATSSMSMPPSVETMMTGWQDARSIRMAR